jgi:hypothetical protein
MITSMMQHRYQYEKQNASTATTSKRSKSFPQFAQAALVPDRPDIGARLCRLAGRLRFAFHVVGMIVKATIEVPWQPDRSRQAKTSRYLRKNSGGW